MTTEEIEMMDMSNLELVSMLDSGWRTQGLLEEVAQRFIEAVAEMNAMAVEIVKLQAALGADVEVEVP